MSGIYSDAYRAQAPAFARAAVSARNAAERIAAFAAAFKAFAPVLVRVTGGAP